MRFNGLLAAVGLLVLLAAAPGAWGQQKCMLTSAQISKLDFKAAAPQCKVGGHFRLCTRRLLEGAQQLLRVVAIHQNHVGAIAFLFPPLSLPPIPLLRFQQGSQAQLCTGCVCALADAVVAVTGPVNASDVAGVTADQVRTAAAVALRRWRWWEWRWWRWWLWRWWCCLAQMWARFPACRCASQGRKEEKPPITHSPTPHPLTTTPIRVCSVPGYPTPPARCATHPTDHPTLLSHPSSTHRLSP